MASVAGIGVHDLPRWVGHLSQIAKIDSFLETDGCARGSRRLRLVTGGGLEADIHPDRALDIGQVTYRGAPLAWMSPTGIAAPTAAETDGAGWLRTFGGGLLTTCGLDSFGPPSAYAGLAYGMHGRIGTKSARLLRTEVVDGTMLVVGETRQAAVFGENLVIHRTISADVGGTSLTVADTVRNDSWSDAGHMILYHCNIGWPLLSAATRLRLPSSTVRPRDATAKQGLSTWDCVEPPTAGFAEQVFCHTGFGREPAIVVDNPEADIRLELRFSADTLPAVLQWKMTGEGHYVLGLEPANLAWTGGRAGAARAGRLPILRAQSCVNYRLQFTLCPSSRN